METINDLLEINNLKIYQNDNWFKFSLESVLLPYFVTINKRTKNIMDFCTGNAPIPLILSTRTKAKIIGVEIQKDIYDLGVKTININHLDNQITILNENIEDLGKYFNGDDFDVITVNPPYFPNHDTSMKNDDIHKTIARHEIYTNLEKIIKMGAFLLKNGGYFAMVHRTDRFFEVIDLLKKYHLEPKKIQMIYPKEDSPSNLFMVEATKNGKKGVKFLNPLFIHQNNGEYREEIKKLFKNIKE